MKRFEFKLARLSRVRAVQEEQARGHWQAAQAIVLQAQAQVEQIANQLLGALEFVRDLQSRPALDPAEVLNARRAIELLESAKRTYLARLQEAQVKAGEARQLWTAARSKQEGLQRMETKARDRHRVELGREESKQADQLAMDRSTKNKRRSA